MHQPLRVCMHEGYGFKRGEEGMQHVLKRGEERGVVAEEATPGARPPFAKGDPTASRGFGEHRGRARILSRGPWLARGELARRQSFALPRVAP